MGKAIIIPGVSFADNNLGKVTIIDAEITGLDIVAGSSYTGKDFVPQVSYSPINAASKYKGVTWLVSSDGVNFGSSITGVASVDNTAGKINIAAAASNATIYLKATSVYNNEIFAVSQSINVTYSEVSEELTDVAITGASFADGKKSQYSIAYTPENTIKTGGTWSIASGGTYASINQSGLLTIKEGALNSAVTIQFVTANKSTVTGDYLTTSKNIVVTYSEPSFNIANNLMFIPVSFGSGFIPSNASFYMEFSGVFPVSGGAEYKDTFLLGIIPDSIYSQYSKYLFLTQSYTGEMTISTSAINTENTTGYSVNPYSIIGGKKIKSIFYSNGVLKLVADDGSEFSPTITSKSWNSSVAKTTGGGFIVHGGTTKWGNYLNQMTSNQAITALIEAGTLQTGASEGKLSSLILIPNSQYSTADELKANPANAIIDLQFDSNGKPYNAASGQPKLLYSER